MKSKSIFTTLLIILIPFISYSQIHTVGDNIQIGRETDIPKGKLSIRSTSPSYETPQLYLDENMGQLGLKIWQEAPNSRAVHFNLKTHDNANGSMLFEVESYEGSIKFATGNSQTFQTRMTINKFGNVLIGNNANEILNNNYRLNVFGSIRSNELVINSDGADYVFAKGYTLKPLNEVEEFIKTNHHLQNVKPASDMQKSGMELGNTVTVLLAKIEELTLYTISQQKEIDSLKEQIKALKK